MTRAWKDVLLGETRAWPAGSAARLLEGLARASLGIPALLSVYALTRWLHLWPGLPLLILAAWWLARRMQAKRAGVELDEQPPGSSSSKADLAWVLLLLLILLVPIVPRFTAAAGAAPRFFFHDEAYLIAIARGQSLDFPPPDLMWSGTKSTYHQGGALLTEAVARVTGLPVQSAFYGLVPVLMRLCFVGAAWRLLERLFPVWSLRRRLGAVAFAAGLFFVDPVAIAWNVRNAVINRQISWDTVVEGVPVVGALRISGAFGDQYFSGPLADVMMLGSVAGFGLAGALPVGAALAVPYLVKAQGGLPFLLGLLAGTGLAALLRRDVRALLPFGVALPFLWVYRSLGPGTSDLIVSLGLGANLRWLERQGAPYAASLASGELPMALVAGAVWAIGRFVLPLGLAAAGASFAFRGSRGANIGLLASLFGALGAAFAFASFVVVRPIQGLQEKFEITHGAAADLLWRPYQGYLEYMFTDVSAAIPNTFVLLGIAMLASAGALEWERVEPRRGRRLVARGLIACAWLFLAGTKVAAVVPGYATAMERSKVVDPLAVQALQRIPVRSSIVMTNDLAYDLDLTPHLPFMNAWAPAVFGHQFWVADFMFNLHYPNIRERFADWRRFWDTPADRWHEKLLIRERIDWILQRRGVGKLDPAQIEGARVVYENAQYRVLARTPEPMGTR